MVKLVRAAAQKLFNCVETELWSDSRKWEDSFTTDEENSYKVVFYFFFNLNSAKHFLTVLLAWCCLPPAPSSLSAAAHSCRCNVGSTAPLLTFPMSLRMPTYMASLILFSLVVWQNILLNVPGHFSPPSLESLCWFWWELTGSFVLSIS